MATMKEDSSPTPNGGVRSAIFYQDDDGNSVDESVATRAYIAEYDKDGNVIHRTYATIGQTPEGDTGG